MNINSHFKAIVKNEHKFSFQDSAQEWNMRQSHLRNKSFDKCQDMSDVMFTISSW